MAGRRTRHGALVESRAVEGGGTTATFVLDKPVMGARVLKELTLRDGHPFLYQRHIFEGGAGALPVANHAMVRLPKGGRISYSPKRWAETPTTALESDPARGRSILAYPARSTDLGNFPRADGGTVDLTTYPIDQGHEDFACWSRRRLAARLVGRRTRPTKATWR